MEQLVFDTVFKQIEIVLKGKDDESTTYYLREMTGAQREQYNNSFKMKLTMEGKQIKASTNDNFTMPSTCFMLSLCLFNTDDKLVPLKFIRELPESVVNALGDKASELSGLDKESAETAKNS